MINGIRMSAYSRTRHCGCIWINMSVLKLSFLINHLLRRSKECSVFPLKIFFIWKKFKKNIRQSHWNWGLNLKIQIYPPLNHACLLKISINCTNSISNKQENWISHKLRCIENDSTQTCRNLIDSIAIRWELQLVFFRFDWQKTDRKRRETK